MFHDGERAVQRRAGVERDPARVGRVIIVWDKEQVAAWPGAERLVEVEIGAICEQERVMPARWDLIEPSRVNPALKAR